MHPIKIVYDHPTLTPILATWQTSATDVVRTAKRIQQIAAPTFAEIERAQAVAADFELMGLADVSIDELGNVYARTPGQQSTPAVMISAHTDTVFPATTDLMIHNLSKRVRIQAPGIGDNSLGVAAMMELARQVQQQGYTPACDIYWVATVGEEGLGDLNGMRAAVDRLGKAADGGVLGVVIVLEGIGLGRVYHAGLGVRRLRVTVSGPGGHSWLHADRPSAAHHLMRLGGALVEAIHPSDEPRSSFNIGLISGGTSINTRAAQASMAIDMRSVDQATLKALEAEVRDTIAALRSDPALTVKIDVVGDRPSATLNPDHELVTEAQRILTTLGLPNPLPERGSTDANIPLAAGIPSVCVGITSGGNAHTTKEYIDTEPVYLGMQQLTLLMHLSCEHIDRWHVWKEDN